MNEYVQHFALADGIYLLNHSVGRMPKQVAVQVQDSFFKAWRESSSEPWQEWLGVIDRFKRSLAGLLNANADEFCPQSNLSSGLSKILSADLKDDTRNVIVASENDFPSMGFVLKKAEQRGYQVRWISKHDSVLDLNVWDQALAKDVCLVLISHVHYNTNTRAPVAEICEMAFKRDILSVVDVAQSIGLVPIDLENWHADIVLGSCVKWLCGGPGAGFLWLGSDRAKQIQPSDVGWFSHEHPFEFDLHNFEYADNANRFWGGTPSILPFDVASKSIEVIGGIGVKKIFAHNRQLTKLLIDSVESGTIVTPLASEARGGTLVLAPRDQKLVEDRLHAASVMFDSRKLGIRLSPHIYNTMDEMSKVAECIAA